MNIIKLIAYPENTDPINCEMCGQIYTDTVSHYIVSCQGIVPLRTEMWNNILNSVSCENKVHLMRVPPDKQMDILLSKPWSQLKDKNMYRQFLSVVAKELYNIMRII